MRQYMMALTSLTATYFGSFCETYSAELQGVAWFIGIVSGLFSIANWLYKWYSNRKVAKRLQEFETFYKNKL